MIRSLLVPVDASEYSRSAFEHALVLARAYDAKLTAMYVLDIRFLEMPPYLDYSYTFEAVPPTILPIEVLEKYRVKSERVLAELAARAGSEGIALETRTEEGVPSQVIAESGRAFDLVVMGKRGEHAKWGRDLLGSTAESVVRRSATPVLLAEGEPRALRTMMVMFDGSDPALRALKLAVDIAARAGVRPSVFTADDDEERGAATLRAAVEYLQAAGVEAEVILESGRAAKAAVSRLERDPVDLVVAGAQGHSALYELILGSTAEHVMRSVALPVLLVP